MGKPYPPAVNYYPPLELHLHCDHFAKEFCCTKLRQKVKFGRFSTPKIPTSNDFDELSRGQNKFIDQEGPPPWRQIRLPQAGI